MYMLPQMGHHLSDQVGGSPAPIGMPAPTAEGIAALPVFTSTDRIAVPLIAVERLRSCIQSGNDGKNGTEQILAAVAPICAEARRTQAMPEHLIVSIKELCRSLPEFDGIRGARERSEFLETVVTLAIEEYYRS
jgi:hypothetical protein